MLHHRRGLRNATVRSLRLAYRRAEVCGQSGHTALSAAVPQSTNTHTGHPAGQGTSVNKHLGPNQPLPLLASPTRDRTSQQPNAKSRAKFHHQAPCPWPNGSSLAGCSSLWGWLSWCCRRACGRFGGVTPGVHIPRTRMPRHRDNPLPRYRRAVIKPGGQPGND